jgi:hypothetical protein
VVAGAEGLERLDRDECLRLLASVPVGRLIFTVNALPMVRPVNFALMEGQRIGRQLPEQKPARADA